METAPETLNDNPLVSITMPAYNRAAFIAEAVQSILSQTYNNWELIIIDDASIDGTKDVIATFTDPRIKSVTHERNMGIDASRNEALRIASGKYIAVLDSDDLWLEKRKLEIQVEFLEMHKDHAVVGTFVQRINGAGKKLGTTTYETEDASIRSHILMRNQFVHSSVVLRNSTVAKTEGYRGNLAEDLDLFLQLGRYGKFANIPETMTAYRIHDANVSGKKLAMIKALGKIVRLHGSAYPNALPALLKNYLRLIGISFHSS